jgi:hypothetical protein
MRGITRKYVNNAVIISSNLTYYNTSYPHIELITAISSNKKKQKKLIIYLVSRNLYFHYQIRHVLLGSPDIPFLI